IMHIEHLELKNFAGFEDFSMDFPTQNVCVFIGENGSGKTSILEGIFLLLGGNITQSKRHPIQRIMGKKQNISTHVEKASAINLSCLVKNKLILMELSSVDSRTPHRLRIINSKNDVTENLDLHNTICTELKKQEFVFHKQFFTTINLELAKTIVDTTKEENKINAYLDNNFFEWYKELSLYDIYITKKHKLTTDYSPKQAVDEAIKRFSGIIIDTEIGENIRDLQVILHKNGSKLSFHHLSQGEQKTINLIGQIIDAFVPPLKEDTGDILDFEGIVLIDEIETHLHPRWQREILPNLANTFPKVQFIVTTHSPQVVSTVPRECVFLLKDFKAIPVNGFTEGKDTNTLLREIFDVAERPASDMKLLGDFYEAIHQKNVAQAELTLAKMRNKWGGLDMEVVRAELDLFDLQEENLIAEGE
ncbi:MAG: AAA family ATPase, partial [Bacteroidia bacterium]